MVYSGFNFIQIPNEGNTKQGFRTVTINMKQQEQLDIVIM